MGCNSFARKGVRKDAGGGVEDVGSTEFPMDPCCRGPPRAYGTRRVDQSSETQLQT